MRARPTAVFLISTICLSAGLCAAAPATAPVTQPAKAEENPYLWKPKTKSVAVFKNGLGFFMAEGETRLRDGWTTAATIPPATFGTLAVYSHVEGQAVDIVGAGPGEVVEFDGRDAPDTLDARRERLEASKHLGVSLTYTHCDQERSAAGKIVSVGPEYVVLAGADGTNFAVLVAGIKRMQMLDLPLRIHLQAQGEKQPEQATLGMAYLRQGITWIPAYTLRVLDEETCELTLRGTIVNEAEDIVHADVHLVVGVPNFLHTAYMEPIAAGQAIRTIGAAVAPPQLMNQITNFAALTDNGNRSRQIQTRDADVNPVPAAPDPGGDPNAAAGNPPQLDEAGAGDFTVYTRKDLTLRRGEKAVVTLFTKKLKYSHLYRWNLPAEMRHYLRIQNDDAGPLTTGPMLAISGTQPLSEDLFKYVPKGGRGELPVTTAINVAGEVTETEADRKMKVYSPQRDVNFDLVTVQGEVKMMNFERKPVEVIITQNVAGKPTAASDDGKTSMNPAKLTLREREGTIRWRAELKPGDSKTVTYAYERYVPSN